MNIIVKDVSVRIVVGPLYANTVELSASAEIAGVRRCVSMVVSGLSAKNAVDRGYVHMDAANLPAKNVVQDRTKANMVDRHICTLYRQIHTLYIHIHIHTL